MWRPDGSLLVEKALFTRRVMTVSFSRDGSVCVCGSSDGTLCAVSTAMREAVGRMRGHTAEITACSVNDSGTIGERSSGAQL